MLQDHLDLRTAREEHSAREHRAPAAGADGITRSRLESGHRRLLATGIRHGAGDPVRLAPLGRGQLLPLRCRLVAADVPALAFPGPHPAPFR